MKHLKEDIEKLLKERYYLSNENHWSQIAQRVGKIYTPVTKLIENMKFIPSTPTLFNANTEGKRKGTLSSCFPMEIDDSIEGIFNTVKDVALVTKASVESTILIKGIGPEEYLPSED
jgi:ribonucleotide reductase alpha subunit